MEEAVAPQPDYAAVVRAWQSRAPWVRRVLARMGLQGKLILCFFVLLFIGRGASIWFFLHYTKEILGPSGSCPARDAALHRAGIATLVVNVAAALLVVPAVMWVVHRIFEPIRKLVAATDKIAAGDLNARVAVYRPDAIGTLARSFNTMAHRVREHQRSLERVNQRLAGANQELEEKVQQRTAQLEAAIRRLNFEIAEKEDFLRAISHDLSAPLRNISGITAMLLHKKRDAFDDEVVHRLERIQKNVEVETELISELMELSKIKSRRQRMEAVDLNDLVSEVASLFENDFQSRRIEFIVDSPLPVLTCEKPRMRQVFQNLVDNAVKYMGEGQPHPTSDDRVKQIRIGSAVREDEVDFFVEDTGMGIDAEDQETIFYVFRRGRNTAVRAIAGKGVGLASVKSIVETYNGNIWVQSEIGKGSIFRFTINGKYLVESKALAGVA